MAQSPYQLMTSPINLGQPVAFGGLPTSLPSVGNAIGGVLDRVYTNFPAQTQIAFGDTPSFDPVAGPIDFNEVAMHLAGGPFGPIPQRANPFGSLPGVGGPSVTQDNADRSTVPTGGGGGSTSGASGSGSSGAASGGTSSSGYQGTASAAANFNGNYNDPGSPQLFGDAAPVTVGPGFQINWNMPNGSNSAFTNAGFPTQGGTGAGDGTINLSNFVDPVSVGQNGQIDWGFGSNTPSTSGVNLNLASVVPPVSLGAYQPAISSNTASLAGLGMTILTGNPILGGLAQSAASAYGNANGSFNNNWGFGPGSYTNTGTQSDGSYVSPTLGQGAGGGGWGDSFSGANSQTSSQVISQDTGGGGSSSLLGSFLDWLLGKDK